jgi:exopolysaccharide production protein ExoZ
MRGENKLYSVHFLRFFAATGVVVFHIICALGNPVTVGAAGVDIFFVVSGLVIGLSIASGETARDFIVKRIIRVMPLYWLATALFMIVSHSTWGYSPDREHILRSLALWPVFGTEWHPIYYAAWTLEYEMFFYAVATVSIAVFRRHALAVCLLFMLMLSVIPVPVPFSHDGAHFGTGMYLEFCAGLTISCAVTRFKTIDRKTALLMITTALVIFAINFAANSVPRQLQWGVPSALLIVGLLAFDRTPVFSSRWANLGGEISYALYLTHISTIQTVSYLGERMGLSFMKHQVTAVLIAVPACIIVATLVHLSIEKPLLNFMRSILLSRKPSDRPGSKLRAKEST